MSTDNQPSPMNLVGEMTPVQEMVLAAAVRGTRKVLRTDDRDYQAIVFEVFSDVICPTSERPAAQNLATLLEQNDLQGLSRYVTTMARNRAIDLVRKREHVVLWPRREQETDPAALVEFPALETMKMEETIENAADTAAALDRVALVIDTLPDDETHPYRAVLRLHIYWWLFHEFAGDITPPIDRNRLRRLLDRWAAAPAPRPHQTQFGQWAGTLIYPRLPAKTAAERVRRKITEAQHALWARYVEHYRSGVLFSLDDPTRVRA